MIFTNILLKNNRPIENNPDYSKLFNIDKIYPGWRNIPNRTLLDGISRQKKNLIFLHPEIAYKIMGKSTGGQFHRRIFESDPFFDSQLRRENSPLVRSRISHLEDLAGKIHHRYGHVILVHSGIIPEKIAGVIKHELVHLNDFELGGYSGLVHPDNMEKNPYYQEFQNILKRDRGVHSSRIHKEIPSYLTTSSSSQIPLDPDHHLSLLHTMYNSIRDTNGEEAAQRIARMAHGPTSTAFFHSIIDKNH